MKPPNLPSLSESLPLSHFGHLRGSMPSARGGNRCGAEHLVERIDHLRDAQFLDVADGGGELAPEVAQQLAPGDLVVGDAVELLLEIGGEIVFDVAGEEAFEERREHAALVLGNEALLVDAHIAAVLEHLQDRGVGRGPADAELLHALDQRGFRIARRRLGEVLAGVDRPLVEPLALIDLGQTARVIVVAVARLIGVVLVLVIEPQEAVELDHLSGGAQVEHASGDIGGDVHGGALELGRLHLAGDRAVPDQFVELGLIGFDGARHLARAACRVGRDGSASCASWAFFDLV